MKVKNTCSSKLLASRVPSLEIFYRSAFALINQFACNGFLSSSSLSLCSNRVSKYVLKRENTSSNPCDVGGSIGGLALISGSSLRSSGPLPGMGYKVNRTKRRIHEYSKALLESREVNEAYSDETIPVHAMTPNSLCGIEIMHT